MFSNDHLNALDAAHEHAHRLCVEAAAERLRAPSATRHIVAVSLRRAAALLDPAPLARRAAPGPGAPVKETYAWNP